MAFLEKLGLSQTDVHCLCRVAGFLDGKSQIKINEFKATLEMRPKMRELWEKQLFRRLLNVLNQKKLTVPRIFQLLDTDDSGTLSPQELQ